MPYQAMPMLGLDVDLTEMDALFDEWDADRSGQIAIREQERALRRGGGCAPDHTQQP